MIRMIQSALVRLALWIRYSNHRNMDCGTRLQRYFFIGSLLILGQSTRGFADQYNDLYESIFRYRDRQMTPDEIKDTLQQLQNWDRGTLRWSSHKEAQDMQARQDDVSFWLGAAELDSSRCNLDTFRDIRARLQRTQYVADRADQGRIQHPSKTRVLNLAIYSQKLISDWVSFCSPQIKVLYDHLQEATEHEYEDLDDLTKNIHDTDRLNPYEIGERVGKFIIDKSNQATLIELSHSLNDIHLSQEIYQRYTPCTRALRVIEMHKGLHEMLTKTRQFRLKSYVYASSRTVNGEDNIKNWMDKVAICAFIKESRLVFRVAIEYMVETDKMIATFAGGSRNFVVDNENRYNSIFRYSTEELSFPYMKALLAVLNSQRTGLLIYDSRRTDVSFWLEAAADDITKCNGEDDEVLRLNLDFDRSRAEEVETVNRPVVTRRILNLETYVYVVRSKRLRYCEHNIGVFFAHKLGRWRKNHSDLRALVEGYHHNEKLDAKEMGRRVADLIVRKEPELDLNLVRDDVDKIKELYMLNSICVSLLGMVHKSRYFGFYGLLIAPRNYQRMNSSLKSSVDMISACNFIEQSQEVFEHAAKWLPLMTGG